MELPPRVPVLNQVVREGPIEKVAFEQRLEGGEGMDHASPGERLLSAALSGTDSKNSGPESLGCARRRARHLTWIICGLFNLLITATQGSRFVFMPLSQRRKLNESQEG